MKIVNFSDLNFSQKAFILNFYHKTKFNQMLSFAVVNDSDKVVGFALLEEKSIDKTISKSIPFNTKQYACKIVRIYEVDLLESKDPYLFDKISKEILNRVLNWKDKKKGQFRYYWGFFNENIPIESYASSLDCEVIKSVEGADTIRYVLYNEI